jgi:hypothetical protein
LEEPISEVTSMAIGAMATAETVATAGTLGTKALNSS